MFLHFKTIKWKNFLSTGNSWTTIDLSRNKTTLIVGSNGQGKSTLLDAITFCLYGKPFRKINKPQLVNSTNKSDLLTEIEFSVGKNEYKIIRGIKPNVFEIFENGVMINQDSKSRDYQEYLEMNILHMNYKAFTQIVVIGNATYMPFMKLSSYDRRNVVEGFLDIDIFTKMNSKLKEIVSETKQTANDLAWKTDIVKEKLSVLNKVLQQSDDSIGVKIKENEDEIKKKNVQISVLESNINRIENELIEICVSNEKIENLKNTILKMNSYEAIFQMKKTNAEDHIKFLNSNDSCPTCMQQIDESYKKVSVGEKQKLVEQMEEGLLKSSEKMKELKKHLTEQLQNVDLLREKNNQIETSKKDVSYIKSEVSRIEKETLKLLEEKKNSLAKEKEDHGSLLDEQKELMKKRDELIEEQHTQAIATILLKDDGIKTKIIRHYLPMINVLINKYLQQMDFFISFNLNENFDEEIKHAAKEDFSYNSFSEGEKLRIDLAILFAWRELAKLKNSANTNLLILDEVFDSSLDVSGIDDFVRIITGTLAKESNTFIISHKGDTLMDKFEHVIKFEKQKGFSKIVD